MNYIIDRLEDGIAMCENEAREMIPVPREQLPPEAKEGDVILEKEGRFYVDVQATGDRRRKMRGKLMDLFE